MYNGEKSSHWKHLQLIFFIHVSYHVFNKSFKNICFYDSVIAKAATKHLLKTDPSGKSRICHREVEAA